MDHHDAWDEVRAHLEVDDPEGARRCGERFAGADIRAFVLGLGASVLGDKTADPTLRTAHYLEAQRLLLEASNVTRSPYLRADALMQSGRVAEDLGAFDAAEAAYRGALESGAATALGECCYASFLSRRGRHQEAEVRFHTALAFDENPTAPYIVLSFGRHYLQKKPPDLEAAVKLFRRAVLRAPKSAEAHFLLGDTLSYMEGSLNEAIEHLHNAWELDPKHPHAAGALADALRVYHEENPPDEGPTPAGG